MRPVDTASSVIKRWTTIFCASAIVLGWGSSRIGNGRLEILLICDSGTGNFFPATSMSIPSKDASVRLCRALEANRIPLINSTVVTWFGGADSKGNSIRSISSNPKLIGDCAMPWTLTEPWSSLSAGALRILPKKVPRALVIHSNCPFAGRFGSTSAASEGMEKALRDMRRSLSVRTPNAVLVKLTFVRPTNRSLMFPLSLPRT